MKARDIRVVIVDDSLFMRRAVERMLTSEPGISVAGSAEDGRSGVAAVRSLKPDVVILDVDMPVMDGLEALHEIMQTCPTPVLMMSTLTTADAEVTLKALELGAVEVVDKSSVGTTLDIYSLGPVLREKVRALAEARTPDPPPPSADEETRPAPVASVAAGCEVVLVGASTGGPRALHEIIPRLPRGFSAAVVIAQHMPVGFTTALAERLDRASQLPVREAVDGALLHAGSVWIAPGGMQTTVQRIPGEGRCQLRVSPPGTYLHRPSVDLLFHSAVEAVGGRSIGVVLTGMGSDGAEGLRAIREAGGQTIAESARSAVIDGMPRSARPAARYVLPLDRIAATLAELCAAPEREEA
jgi:two-component system, chemotaxis family, protein-glutamate methylesterase/glutaminase